MAISFNESMTKTNLLKSFAGESQARNRYTFAAECAKKDNLYVVEAVFKFTANQELAHGKVFYDLLSDFSGEKIEIEGNYPIDVFDDVKKLLEASRNNEYEENDTIYKNFADIAEEEGFAKIATTFRNIAGVEKIHGDRFGELAQLMEENKLFISDIETKWMCLNCGFIYNGTNVPEKCPVCSHPKGYFIRLNLSPYTN